MINIIKKFEIKKNPHKIMRICVDARGVFKISIE
jgi:hypothetical protein